jgi:hypothetical protein
MSPAWFARNLVRASLPPVISLLVLSLVTAGPVEAATSDPAQQNATPAPAATPGNSAERMDSSQSAIPGLRRRVKLATAEMARLKPHNSAPAGSAAANLTYHSGPVENTPQVYLSFWGSDWNGGGYAPAINYLEGFFGNVGGSPWLAVNSQYCSGAPANATSCTGSAVKPITNPTGQLKATWVDTKPVTYGSPASDCGLPRQDPGDCDVMKAAQRAADHFAPLPKGAVIMVFSPSGKSQPGFVNSGWCAYHWSTVRTGAAFGYLPYMPDAGGSCGRNSVNAGGTFDGYSIVGGHEYAEAITDPYPDSGWIDANGAENGDKCSWVGLGNVNLGGRPYAMQPTWSNAIKGCQMAQPQQSSPPPPPAPQSQPAVFSSLGGSLTSAPATTSWGPGRLDVFARGAGNALIHRSFSGGNWSATETLGGVMTSEPAAVSWAPGRLDVFVRGSDNALWHTFGDGTRWFGWESLGGVLKAGPAVASWSEGHLDVFVTGSDNAVYHRSFNGGWSGWDRQAGVATVASPAAVSWGMNRVDVFVQGTNNSLWHMAWTGAGWSGWENLGGTLSWSPSVTSTSFNQLSIFVRGTDNALYRKNWNGSGWSAFQPVGGGQWTSGAAATSQLGSNKIDLVTKGTDNGLWYARVS